MGQRFTIIAILVLGSVVYLLLRSRLHRRLRWIPTAAVFILGAAFVFWDHRLTAIQALSSRVGIEWTSSAVVQEVDEGWGKVFVVDTPSGLRTVGCAKTVFLWSCPVTVRIDRHPSEPVETIGWMSWSNGSDETTVLAVEVRDPSVVYIEAGPEDDRSRKAAVEGGLVFRWPKAMFGSDIEPLALSDSGEVLYAYKLAPKGSSVSVPGDLTWQAVGPTK